jgi:hypothetical protein
MKLSNDEFQLNLLVARAGLELENKNLKKQQKDLQNGTKRRSHSNIKNQKGW